MKSRDYNLITQAIQEVLESQEWSISNYLSPSDIEFMVANIYTTNDIAKGFGQDFHVLDELGSESPRRLISIISTPYRISVILDSQSSFYKADLPICGYASVAEDIENIFVIIQAVLDRIGVP